MFFFINKKSKLSIGKSNKKHKNSNNLLTFFSSMLGGGLIGIIIIYLFHYKYLSNKNLALISSANTKPSSKLKSTTSKQSLANKIDHQYDFYNILTSPTNNNVNSNGKTLKHNYLLQLGTFQNLTNADELKAKLALQGFEAKIETINLSSNKKATYKVVLGPFDSLITANEKKTQLNLAGFDNKLVKTN